MRIELVFLFITTIIVGNIYTDGKYIKQVMDSKKHLQIAGVTFAAYMLYVLIKKDPLRAGEILKTSNEYLKYMPLDKNSNKIISPFLNFTATNYMQGTPGTGATDKQQSVQTIQQSGKKGSKRSVSETKKKYIASNQNWKCGDCKTQLTAWFEVDHKVRLEYGGSNHVDNLVALCRECHGKKTAMENM
jgi:hypothetical protein